MIADILIIGGGIVGCSIARELSRFQAKTVLVEAREDVARGASGANSGIVHAGYDPEEGSLMAKYNVLGCAMYPALSQKLGFPYKNTGSLVVAFDDAGLSVIRELYERGLKNGVPKLSLISGEEARKLEKELSEDVKGALLSETAGIVSPYEATVAFAEHAAVNGVTFYLGERVERVFRTEEGIFSVLTSAEREIKARVVINCAGAGAAHISDLFGAEHYETQERKGEYTLYDRNYGSFVSRVIFQTPDAGGKGVLVTPTAEGNLLLGPSSDPLDREHLGDTSTTQEGQDRIFAQGRKSTPNLPFGGAITGFAGIRAVVEKDFIIGPSEKVPELIQLIGICSPGLTSAPAIALDVAQMALMELKKQGQTEALAEIEGFIDTREGIVSVRELSFEARAELCKKDADYGKVVCRCETVTEGQIKRALASPIPVYTLDGVKRRCRAGMGRCQGSFCTPRVMQLIAEAAKIPFEKVRKAGEGTEIGQGRLKSLTESEVEA